MQVSKTLKMTLPKIPDIELVAVEGMDRMARHLGISEEKINEAHVLIIEAVINAFEHSGAENSEVQVEFTINQEELIIFVRDFGKGFDPNRIEKLDIHKKLGSKYKRGWGLKLMETMSDDFKVDSDKNGTTITFIKKLL
jgi:anti-sigma regulatory factor (Ser/Thr protein kinase)